MDSTLWSSIVTAVVAVVAIVTTSRSSAGAVKAARDATAGADAAAQRAEVWRRFEWAVAAVTEPGTRLNPFALLVVEHKQAVAWSDTQAVALRVFTLCWSSNVRPKEGVW